MEMIEIIKLFTSPDIVTLRIKPFTNSVNRVSQEITATSFINGEKIITTHNIYI